MELTIDTSQLIQQTLNNQSSLLASAQCKIEKDIHNIINNVIKEQEIVKENITIHIETITYHHFDKQSIVIYSKIIKNNQSRYSLLPNQSILVFIENQALIDKIVSKINSNSNNKQMLVNIDDCIIIPFIEEEQSDKAKIKALTYLLPSLIKLYICIISKHSYNKHNSILINASCLTESMLLCKGLSILGYIPYYIHLSHFDDQWTNSTECNKVSLNDNNTDTYNYILDLTGEMLLAKRKLFSMLKYGGMFYGVNYTDNNYNNSQLIPEDFRIIQSRGLGISLISIEQSIQHFVDYGKIINYCNEIIKKSIDDNIIKCLNENIKIKLIDISQVPLNDNNRSVVFDKGINLIVYSHN